MARSGDDGHVHGFKALLEVDGVELLQPPIAHVGGLVLDRRLRSRDDGRRERSGEDEPRGVGSDGVDQGSRGGDVATYDSVGLAERGGDDVDPIHDGTLRTTSSLNVEVAMLGHTRSSRSVHPDGVYLVEEGDGPVLFGEVADLLDRSDATAHRVDRLERDDLRLIFGEGP